MAEANEEEVKENEVVRGLLLFEIDGKTRPVPELKWRANREWQALLQTTFAALVSVPSDTPEGQRTMGDAERELVLAYDSSRALGDLEDATERDIDLIYNKLVEVAFPLAQSPMAMLLTLVRAAGELALGNSTNGPSPSGDSAAPMILKPSSPSDRSPSSTRKPRSAIPKNSASA
jgi:hypothetical protein